MPIAVLQYLFDGALNLGIFRHLGQQTYLWGNHFHQFPPMAVYHQIHVETRLVQCMQKADEAHLSPTEFHIVHGDENALFHIWMF